jgi:5-methylcytosine-specific restriction endonuclease McrA
MASRGNGQYQRNRRNLIKRNLQLNGKYVCEYCSKNMQFHNSKEKDYVTIDHLVPLSNGGSNRIDNLVVCCNECNHTKADLSILEFFLKKKQAC